MSSRMTLVVAMMVCLNALSLSAATIKAASVSYDDVLDALASAIPGDTVLLPAGQAVWSSKLVLDKAVTLMGAGMRATTIINALADDYTGLIDIRVDAGAGDFVRISSIGLTSDRTNTKQWAIYVDGTLPFRIDHVRFFDTVDYLATDIRIAGYGTYGVVDNCEFDGSTKESIQVFGGNQSWGEDSTLGTASAVYIEDCVFRNSPGGHAAVFSAGSKGVVRYCEIFGKDLDAHGHCFNRGFRGVRHYEFYENDIWEKDVGFNRAMFIRGGTGVIFDNRVRGDKFYGDIELTEYRVTTDCPNNGCGTEGYPLYDQIGRGKDQTSEPLYMWGNVADEDGDGVFERAAFVTVVDARTPVCNLGPTADYIQPVAHGGEANPDYVVGTALPGYAPFTYPHPLRALSHGEPLPSDDDGSSDEGSDDLTSEYGGQRSPSRLRITN